MFRFVAPTDERQKPMSVADNPTRLTALLAMNRPLSLAPLASPMTRALAHRGKPTTTDDDFNMLKNVKNKTLRKLETTDGQTTEEF
jgi:hypothetical protein